MSSSKNRWKHHSALSSSTHISSDCIFGTPNYQVIGNLNLLMFSDLSENETANNSTGALYVWQNLGNCLVQKTPCLPFFRSKTSTWWFNGSVQHTFSKCWKSASLSQCCLLIHGALSEHTRILSEIDESALGVKSGNTLSKVCEEVSFSTVVMSSV